MPWTLVAAILGGIAVATGAFGAHGLQSRLDAQHLDWWDKAVRYQFWHVLALLAVEPAWRWATAQARPELVVWANRAGWGFFVGILLFSGSLQVMALTDFRKLGMVTPLGGLSFIAGWVCLALAARR
ncbi:MAG: DUF423 domain-containing protein [Deltaproteobacteria bacterium]|nr:DUF423 domain-containing protein [Deltaproteobacteria bacterium]